MRAIGLLGVAVLVAAPLGAQENPGGLLQQDRCGQFAGLRGADVFENVQYRAGHGGYPDRISGTLYLTKDSLVLVKACDSVPTLRVPLSIITSAEVQSSTRDPNFGDKLMMGAFAREKHEEFIQLATQTPVTVEVIVFKVPSDVGPGLVQKIRFYAKLPLK